MSDGGLRERPTAALTVRDVSASPIRASAAAEARRRRFRWLAGPNLISHATNPADRWRTLCGATQVLERLAYPPDRRCLVCETRAGEVVPIGR